MRTTRIELEDLRATAPKCRLCHDYPATRRMVRKRRMLDTDSADDPMREMEVCVTCALLVPSANDGKYWRDVGPARNEYAMQVWAKEELVNYLGDYISHRDFEESVRALRSLFRRRRLPRNIQRIQGHIRAWSSIVATCKAPRFQPVRAMVERAYAGGDWPEVPDGDLGYRIGEWLTSPSRSHRICFALFVCSIVGLAWWLWGHSLGRWCGFIK